MRYALLFVAFLVPFTYFDHNEGWNQTGRLAQLHAVVMQHTIRIDAYHEITGDKAIIDGHYYSEKAPAISLLALPSFFAAVVGERLAGLDPDGPLGWRISGWIATASSIGVISALGGVALFALLETRMATLEALIAAFGIFFGTLAFPYATSLFAHAGTIGLLTIALWGALGQASPRRDYIAGLAAGLSVASEYPAILSCAVIGLYLGWVDRRRMWRFGMATVPAALLILINNYAMTGSPFSLSYGSNAQFPDMNTSNLLGFSLPDLTLTPTFLWSEYRGLFFWSPILLMALPGVVVMFRQDRAAAVMALAGFGLVFLQVAAFYNWFGGNCIGMRYLAPGLPFLAVIAAYGIKRFPEMGLILMVVSVVLMGMVTAISIEPPGDSLTPLQDFYLVRIDQHRYADNLGTLAGLPLWASLCVPFVVPFLASWRLLRNPLAAA